MPLRGPRADGPRRAGSRSHPDPLLVRRHEALGITDLRPSGSLGATCGLITPGERGLYLHPTPYLEEWGTCAPKAIPRAAGGDVTGRRGEPLRHDKPLPRQPHGAVACGPGVPGGVPARVRPVYPAAAA